MSAIASSGYGSSTPGAHQHGSRFWLRTAFSPIGEGGLYPVLAARVHHHEVIGFKGWVGAAGD
jgi:hypothetical protein